MDNINKTMYNSFMEKLDKDTYILKFDFKKGETDILSFLSHIAEVVDGFEQLNKAVCGGIDSDIDVTSYLVDVESGSLKTMLRDGLKKIPDQIVMDAINDPKKVLGQILVAVKHFVVKKMEETKSLPQEEKEALIYEAATTAIKDERLNPLLPCEINKEKLLSAVSQISKASKNIEKVSFISEDITEAEVIDTSFCYNAPPPPQTMTQTINVVLIIKKPDLYGSSRWEFIFDKQISATIEDKIFLQGLKDKTIGGFYHGDKIECKMRIETYLNEHNDILDTKYFIVQVLKFIKSSDPDHPQLFELE